MGFLLPLSASSQVISILVPTVVASALSLLTFLLAKPKQKAEVGAIDASALADRIAADTSMSAESREWVQLFARETMAAKERAEAAEQKADRSDEKADAATQTAQHCAEQGRLHRQWIAGLEEQVRQLGGTPMGPPEGLDP